MSKNLFSTQAESYSKYRPVYPQELFDYILQFVAEKNIAWDCATGNGQAAYALAPHFKKIIATDISEKQLAFAKQHTNIQYIVLSAENTGFPADTFDLVTVAQAYHWFQFDAFEFEVKRVSKNDAVIAIWGYSLMTVHDVEIDALVKRFYADIVGPYWDAERKYIDDHYNGLPFNFAPLPSKDFFIHAEWNKKDLTGFLNSWSSVQHFITAKKYDPVDEIINELGLLWKDDEVKKVTFPIFLKLGKVNK